MKKYLKRLLCALTAIFTLALAAAPACVGEGAADIVLFGASGPAAGAQTTQSIYTGAESAYTVTGVSWYTRTAGSAVLTGCGDETFVPGRLYTLCVTVARHDGAAIENAQSLTAALDGTSAVFRSAVEAPRAPGNANIYFDFAAASCTAGHHGTLTELTVAATCTEPGFVRTVCEACGEVVSQTQIPATGHRYSNGRCSRCAALLPNPFIDVSSSAVYFEAAMWAYYSLPQITGGVYENRFCPDNYCSRGQTVTFIWRALGCPEPSGSQSPFSDVSTASPFFKAIVWAAENGIATGYENGSFGVSETVTRAQFMAFLWRSRGCPAPQGTTQAFSDVPRESAFYSAVMWASENGIAMGYGDGTFGATAPCKRLHTVLFLYRCFG